VRSAWKLILLLLASVAILTGVVYFVGFEKTWRAVEQAGWLAFLGAGALSLVLLMLQAGAWDALNPPIQHHVPFITLLKGATVGLAVNIVTPSTYLGGEPAKVLYIGRKTGLPYREIAGTVVLAKYLEALSFILFFSFSTVVAALYYRDLLFAGPNLPVGIALLVIATLLLGACAVLWLSLSRRWRPLTRLVGWLVQLRVKAEFFRGLRERTSVMEGQVSRVFCAEGGAARRSFLLFVCTHVVIFLKPAVFFLLGSKESRVLLGLGQMSLIFVACQALLAFQITPSGVGPLDAGMIGTFAIIGLAEPQLCMAYLLCIRFWDAVVVGVGALLAARAGAGILTGGALPMSAAADDAEPQDETAA